MSNKSGARFYKCALQVNPYGYLKQYRGKEHSCTEDEYYQKIIDECMEREIEVLAITDHNHSGAIEKFRSAVQGKSIHIFPGFEVSSKEGVHVLCIFDENTAEATLNRHLGGLSIDETSPNSDLSGKNFEDILAFVKSKGGITIAAHATQNSGLLFHLKGQTRVKAWTDPNLLAIQVPSSVLDLPDDKRKIVLGKESEYKREFSPPGPLEIALVNSMDITVPEDLRDSSSTCSIKMSKPSIEGFRQAFLDPESRIRLNSDDAIRDYPKIKRLTCDSGFLSGIDIYFNENLNVLIGGRGAGKSTVIEALRYALDIQPIGPNAKKVHEKVVKDVIRSGTLIKVHLHSPHPAPMVYVVERTPPNDPVIKSINGDILPLKITDLTKGILVLGQHEIGELTENTTHTTELLGKFTSDSAEIEKQKKELQAKLSDNRTRFESNLLKINSKKEKVESLPGLEHEHKRFVEVGLEGKLKVKGELVAESATFGNLESSLSNAHSELTSSLEDAKIDVEEIESEDFKSLPGSKYLDPALKQIQKWNKVIDDFSLKIDALKVEISKSIEDSQSEWSEQRKVPAEASLKDIFKKLQNESVDIHGFIELKEAIEALKPAKAELKKLETQFAEIRKERENLLASWSDCIRRQFSSQESAAKEINKLLKNQLKIAVNFSHDKLPLIVLLKDKVGGRLDTLIKAINVTESLSVQTFTKACRLGVDKVTEMLPNTSKDQAKRVVESGESLFLLLEELDLPHTTSILLNVSGPNDIEWKPMDDLSKGQKATAILLLLLLKREGPLVIDQPEDDLDNKFIAEGIVPKIRESKNSSQFIFSTHNANIPVLGDAEQICGLTASGEALTGQAVIDPNNVGSIDQPGIQKLIKNILEGGPEAFEMRRKRYGLLGPS